MEDHDQQQQECYPVVFVDDSVLYCIIIKGTGDISSSNAVVVGVSVPSVTSFLNTRRSRGRQREVRWEDLLETTTMQEEYSKTLPSSGKQQQQEQQRQSQSVLDFFLVPIDDDDKIASIIREKALLLHHDNSRREATTTTPDVLLSAKNTTIRVTNDVNNTDAKSSSSLLLTVSSSRNHHVPTKHLVVVDCSGYCVADFCGVGGYHQVLLLPRCPITPPPISNQQQQQQNTEAASAVLKDMLLQSVLTDGQTLWLPENVSLDRDSVLEGSTRSIYRLTLPPSGTASVVASSISHSFQKRSAAERTQSFDSMPSKGGGAETNDSAKTEEEKVTGTWRQTLQRRVDERVCSMRTEAFQQQHRLQQQRRVMEQSRSVLRNLSCSASTTIPGTIANVLSVYQVRYRSQPSSSVGALDGCNRNDRSEVALLLEVDLCRRGTSIAEQPSNEQQNIYISVVALKDQRLESGHPPSFEKSRCNVKVTTRSGIIPSLDASEPNGIATIVVLVHLQNLDTASSCSNGSNEGIGLTLVGHWTDTTIRKNKEKKRRRGSSLVSFNLPNDAMVVPIPERSLSSESNGMVILGYPEGSKESESNIAEQVVYDFRQPNFINVDVSSASMSPVDWNGWVERFNKEILAYTFHCIDLAVEKHVVGAVVTLVVYCYPMTAIHQLRSVIRDKLPAQALLIDQ